MRASIILVGLGLMLGLPTNVQAVDPAVKCEADKLKTAGKYSGCRLKAESTGLQKGLPPDFTKCDSKYGTKWDKIEAKAEAKGPPFCPTSGDAEEIKAQLTTGADALTAEIAGKPGPKCGDGVKNANDDCDGSDLGGATCESLGFESGTLACSVGCGLDVSSCVPFSPGAFPATGQMTCWNSGGSVVPCAGTDHDGEIQAGATLAYTDNGNGTVTDLNTGLMWEKKSDDGSIHDKDTTYIWDNAFAVHVAGLNTASFAGHTDWRVPNIKELHSIVDYETFSPSVDPVFNTGCTGGCTVTTCSCTEWFDRWDHWSTTSNAFVPAFAMSLRFNDGGVSFDGKSSGRLVRAVRGGL